jgi:hypothetical protein
MVKEMERVGIFFFIAVLRVRASKALSSNFTRALSLFSLFPELPSRIKNDYFFFLQLNKLLIQGIWHRAVKEFTSKRSKIAKL